MNTYKYDGEGTSGTDVEKEKDIDKKTYVRDTELDRLADEVIKKEATSLILGDARITYLKVYPNISKKIAGKCIRASRELKFFSDYDYIIEMSGDLWDKLDDEKRYILMHHELMHVCVEYDKNGNEVYRLRDHDVQDFYLILQRHGVDWIGSVKEAMENVNDDDKSLDSVKL